LLLWHLSFLKEQQPILLKVFRLLKRPSLRGS